MLFPSLYSPNSYWSRGIADEVTRAIGRAVASPRIIRARTSCCRAGIAIIGRTKK